MDHEPTKQDIEAAYTRITPYVHKTLLLQNQAINSIANSQIYFKCQNLQKGGAFKARGAANKMLQLGNPIGVCTHSSGNHAQALAYIGKKLNIPVTIVMPSNSPQVKVNAVKEYGAEVILCGITTKDRQQATEKVMKQKGFTLVHPYNDWDIVAGQATASYEMYKQLNQKNIELDYVVFPIGGGGLASGTLLSTKYFSPNTKKIGVQPEMAQDAYLGLKQKKIHPQLTPKTIADGLRTSLGEKTFKIISQNIDQIILVTQIEIIKAARLFWQRTKLMIEPSSATVLAAIIKDERFKNKKVGAILSGGNVDLSNYGKLKPEIP